MFSRMARSSQGFPMSSLDRDMLYRKPEPPAHQEPAPTYLVGLSVGQGTQPTGMAVLERHKRGSGAPATYTCRYLRRWLPPATAYTALLAHLRKMFGDPPLAGGYLIVEAGPSTKALLSFLRKNPLSAKIQAVEIKTSAEDRKVEGLWKVAKGTVIETTRQVSQEGRLVFDRQMSLEVTATTPPAQTVYHALATYPYNEATTVNDAFTSRDGEYDDLVLAVALACWYGENCQRTLAILW
jgi:hypothetical protein